MFQSNIFRVLYSIYSLAIGILILLFSALIYFGFSSNKSIYLQTLDDWQKQPISDIYVLKNTTDNCQPGEESVFKYNWPGTKEGCLCDQNNQIQEGQCCQGTNKNGCCQGKPINPIINKTLDIWSVNGFKFKLCATKLANYSFKNNAPQNLNCLASEQWCGKDNQGNQDENYGFCVPTNSKCPVQDIQIGETNPDPTIYEQINLFTDKGGKTFWIFLRRNGPLKLPLINFMVSSSEDIYLNDHISTNEGYQLNNVILSCNPTDLLFQKTEISISEQTLLDSNDLSQQLSALPNYYYSTNQLSLFSKSYPSLKLKCRDIIQNFYDNVDVIQHIEDLSLPNFIICCLYCSILILFDTWIGFKYNKFSWGVIIFKDRVSFLVKSVYILKYILFLSCNFLVIFQSSFQIQINNFLSDLINRQCLDSNQNYFNLLQYRQIRDKTIAILICAWMHFLAEPNVFYLINKFCCSQLQDFMKSKSTNQKTKNNPNQIPSKDVSICMERPEENALPQSNNISFNPNCKAPSKKQSSHTFV